MRKLEIQFSDDRALCVFPENRDHLPRALGELGLAENWPVIVLIGGYTPDRYAEATQKAIGVIASFARVNGILIICGGTTVGIMGSIGQTRASHAYGFPLLGITLEKLVTWPKGPRSRRFLWWGTERWPLSIGYSHFMLVPGNRFGEDSPWLADAAACLSHSSKSVTILANGGGVARQDIGLSLVHNRPVIALAGTGRLADELAGQPDRPTLVEPVQADDEKSLTEAMQDSLNLNTAKGKPSSL